jgi:hypothetical protein
MRVAAPILSALLVAAGPAPPAALRVRGAVVVNSVPQADGATLRPGDTVTTGPRSLAIATSRAFGRVELRAESEARIDAGGILLGRGAVAADRLPITTGRYSIRPQPGPDAWYAVARRNGRLLVAAHRGAVVIEAAGQDPVTVPQGSYAEKQEDPNPPPPAQTKAKKRRRRGAAGAATSGGWTIGGLSHAASVALVVGVGAGVAAVTAGAILHDPPPSPND